MTSYADPACLLPLHAPIRAPTSSYGCLFSSFLSNLIVSPLILRGWGRTLFSSNQIKPRTREHGWAHAGGAGKSRPGICTVPKRGFSVKMTAEYAVRSASPSHYIYVTCFCFSLYWFRTYIWNFPLRYNLLCNHTKYGEEKIMQWRSAWPTDKLFLDQISYSIIDYDVEFTERYHVKQFSLTRTSGNISKYVLSIIL